GDREQIAGTPLTGVRIGLSPFFWSGLDPEVERVSNEALQKLSDSGATLVWSEIPEFAEAMGIALTIIAYDTLPGISGFLQEQGADVIFEQRLEQAGEGFKEVIKSVALPPNRPSKEIYESILGQREELRKSVRSYFEAKGIVALAFPPIMIAPPRIGEDSEV